MLGLAVQGVRKFAFTSPEAFLWGMAVAFSPMLLFTSHMSVSWSLVGVLELMVVVALVWFLFRYLGQRMGVLPRPTPQAQFQ